MTDIADMKAVALTRAIRAREVSPVEAVKAALDRIEARKALNAFITVTADQALAAARDAERAILNGDAVGALHGVPYSVKDLTNTAGVRTTMGSALFADNVPKEDAIPVARAKAAGAILIGKTTTPEFGHKQLTEGPLFGLTLNPIDPDVTCGASSGGAAAAVVAGMGPVALGSDGGGSIRIPAACCGIVGHKATLGVIANLQPPDLFGANSYVGPMARDVADTTLLFDVVAGFDPRDPYGQGAATELPKLTSFKGVRVGYLETCGNKLDARVATATRAAVRRMAELGAVVEPINLDFVALEPAFLVMLESSLAARLAPYLEHARDKLDPHLVEVIERGLRRTAVEAQNAASARTATFRAVQQQFERVDLIVSPVLSTPPLPLGPQLPDGPVVIDGEPAGAIRGGWYPYTYPFNLTGHPALSLPCGWTAEGLPIGLQIAGPWHSDRRLLSAAALLEAALG